MLLSLKVKEKENKKNTASAVDILDSGPPSHFLTVPGWLEGGVGSTIFVALCPASTKRPKRKNETSSMVHDLFIIRFIPYFLKKYHNDNFWCGCSNWLLPGQKYISGYLKERRLNF